MSQSDQLWRYAEAAMLGAHKSKNEAEKRALLDLARLVALAALESEGMMPSGRVQSGHHEAHAA